MAGLKVDAKGCPIEVTERETELLDTGMIRLQNVNFETNKSDILPDSYPTLDAVGTLLTRWPQLKLEIGGHTDSRGSAAANQKLSEARAEAVRTYLTGKFAQLAPGQFTVKGYGEAKPVVRNTSELNWAKNRRVEFVVINKDVLRKEIERRRLLQQNEAAPRDTTTAPAPTPAPADTTKR
jgi:outer membrane protein OmpA-like peptidoglycan-associated protein